MNLQLPARLCEVEWANPTLFPFAPDDGHCHAPAVALIIDRVGEHFAVCQLHLDELERRAKEPYRVLPLSIDHHSLSN